MGTGETRRLRHVAAAAVSGQAIEYYDFLLYASAAAVVFGPVFFPSTDERASTAAAFATFAIGFVMRPVGAVVFGHLGDRVGRRRTLLITLVTMGVATTLIGLLPTYRQVGVAAPICLVILRCLQGLSVGGEWGGAVLLAVEHAPPGRRAFWGSLPQMGSPLGQLTSTLALLAVSQLPDADFKSWGWRIPFLITAAFLLAGLRARRLIAESPEFERATRAGRHRLPFVSVLRSAPRAVFAGFLAAALTTAGFYLVNTFTVAYVVNELGLRRDVGLYGQIVTGSLQLLLVPLVGVWALRRRPHRLAAGSAWLAAAWAFPLFALIETGVPAAVWLGQAVATIFLTGVWALLPELLASQFPVEVRYTGISLCLQTSSVLGGLSPLVASSLLDAGGGRPWLVAALLAIVGLASALGIAAFKTPGGPAAASAQPRRFPARRVTLEELREHRA